MPERVIGPGIHRHRWPWLGSEFKEAAAGGDLPPLALVVAGVGGVRPLTEGNPPKLAAVVVELLGSKVDLRWGQQRALDEATSQLRAHDLAVPRASQLTLDPELLHAAVRAGLLVRITDDLVYLPDQIEVITSGLASMHDGFTVAEFRDKFGLSRRQAVPLLEWLDAQGWTSRAGDVRSVRRRPSSQPGSPDAPPP